MVDPTVYRYLKDATSQLPARKLVVDHGDSKSTLMSGSLVDALIERPNFNENLTTYALYPYELNQPPIIVESVADASQPKIYNSANWIEGQKALYQNSDGSITAARGTRIVLKVIAQQPEILNVQNGIPTVLQGSADLTYTWTFNGVEIPDNSASNSDDRPEGVGIISNMLEITSVEPTSAGAYACIIANDAASTSTQPILLQVFDPFSSQTDVFRKNLVTNPTFTDGASGWSNAVGEVQRKSFNISKGDSKQHLIELKKINNATGTGFAPEMLQPQADTITYSNVTTVDGDAYTLSTLLDGSGGYLTRSDLTYGAAKGKKIVIAYQDIDLSSIQDYIAGKVWGIDGVKAYFSCYLGNGISRIVPTEKAMTKEERNDLGNYWKLTPKLSLENILLTGLPLVDEKVTVYVQEYFDNELLTSRIFDTTTGEIHNTNVVSFVDPLTAKLNNLSNDPVYTEDGVIAAQITEPAGRIAKAYKELYKDKANYYSNGQVVRQQELIFDQLNARTNRVRISLKFQLDTIRFEEGDQTAVDNSRMLENVSYETVYKTGLLERGDYLLTQIQKTKDGYQDAPITKAFLDASVSRTLATGFAFITNPIVSNEGFTKGNNLFLTNTRQITTQINYDQLAAALTFQPESTDFTARYLGTANKFRQITYQISTNQKPNTQPTPAWASLLDWRDTTQVWSATVEALQTNPTTRQTEPIQTISYGPFEKAIEDPNSRYHNELDTNRLVDLSSTLQFNAITLDQKLGGDKVVTSNPIAQDNASSYLSNTLNNAIAPTTIDLRKWVDSSYVTQVVSTLSNKRRMPLQNTFEVEFHLYHHNSNNVFEKIGTVTKYMLAGKTIKLTLADFIPENELPSRYEFATKEYDKDRNVYVVPYSIKHVFKLNYWKGLDHQIPIGNLKERTQAIIDNLTWENEDYRYSDELKINAQDATVNYIKPNNQPLDHTTAGAIQWMINELTRLKTDTVLWSYTDSFGKLTERLKAIRDDEGYQTPPPKTILTQNTNSQIATYIDRSSNTLSSGLINIALDTTNNDINTYTYKINSYGKQQIV